MILPSFHASPSRTGSVWYAQVVFGRAVAGVYWYPDGTLSKPTLTLLDGDTISPKVIARFHILPATKWVAA